MIYAATFGVKGDALEGDVQVLKTDDHGPDNRHDAEHPSTRPNKTNRPNSKLSAALVLQLAADIRTVIV